MATYNSAINADDNTMDSEHRPLAMAKKLVFRRKGYLDFVFAMFLRLIIMIQMIRLPSPNYLVGEWV